MVPAARGALPGTELRAARVVQRKLELIGARVEGRGEAMGGAAPLEGLGGMVVGLVVGVVAGAMAVAAVWVARVGMQAGEGGCSSQGCEEEGLATTAGVARVAMGVREVAMAAAVLAERRVVAAGVKDAALMVGMVAVASRGAAG